MAEMPNEPDISDSGHKMGREFRPKSFSRYIYITFFWCMVGASIIYGIRLWHDAPLHPFFVPIIGGVFAAILSFTLVMALEYVIGPININVGGNTFSGAGGPIILWCLCFLVICFGLYLLGAGEVTKHPVAENYVACSTGDLMRGQCNPVR
ncbi:MAG: hypothetical protein E6Q59_08365 [Nitrosomonas sp.]|nr:MAG: hypothetical protein E6Q59_08365 [Nitrosomonas sp.]